MSNTFKTWNEVEKELFTPEEIAESKLRVALVGEIIKARKEKGLSQRELEQLSGVKQPVIARMEGLSSKLCKFFIEFCKTGINMSCVWL